MKNILYLLIILLTCSLFSCEEEEDVDPKIETLIPQSLSASSAVFKGNIVERGSIKILDYGFVYEYGQSSSSLPTKKISLGDNPAEGLFEAKANNLFLNEYYYYSELYVRAYITNEKGTVYGKPVNLSMPTLAVESFSPQSGVVGDLVTIKGENFDSDKEENIVKFGQTTAEIVSATTTELVVKVPDNYDSYYDDDFQVSVNVGRQAQTAQGYFKVLYSISGFYPQVGSYGTIVTISGHSFPLYGSINVTVGGVTAYVIDANRSFITIEVPSGLTKENSKIVVNVNGIIKELEGTFTLLPPKITSVSHTTVLSGMQINISGDNFNYTPYNYNCGTKVFLGTHEASVSYCLSNNITAVVPYDLSPGSYEVSVFTGAYTVKYSQKITVVDPFITDISPSSSKVSTLITVSGKFNNSASTYILLNDHTIDPTLVDLNEIKFYVPELALGTYTLKVVNGDKTLTAEQEFTVIE